MGYTVKPNATLLATGGVWSSASNVQGIIDSFNNPANKYDLQRDEVQNNLIKKQNDEVQNTYNKINSLPGTSHLTLDKNIQNFFMEEIDYGFDIKMLAKNGKMGQREANKILAKLGNDMNTYTALAPQILAQAKIMKEAIATGTISRANADEMQLMFMGIANNAGDIKIDRDEDGNMYLAGSGTVGGEEWSGRVNIQEIQQYLDGEGAQIARTIPTSDEMGLKAVYADLAAKGFIDDYGKPTYDQSTVGDRKMRTDKLEFGETEIANLSEALMNNPGLFENFMTSEGAVAAWVDIANADLSPEQLNTIVDVPKTIPDPNCPEGEVCEKIPNPDYNEETAGKEKWGDWDINNKNKRDYLKKKLIDRMLAENLDKEIIGKMVVDQEYYNRQNALLSNKGPMGNMTAGAKDNYAYFQKIVESVRSGDLSGLSEMKPEIKIMKQPGGKWAIVKLKQNSWNDKWVEDKVYNSGLSIDNPKMIEDLFDIFGVTKYLPQYGVDVRQLVGKHNWNWGKEFEGIGEEIRQFNMKNPDASLDEILKLEYGKGDDKVTILDRINSDLVPGVTIDDDEIVYEGPNADMKKKFDGKDLTKDLLVDLMNWINRTGLVQKRSDAYHTSRTAIDNLNKFRSTSKN